VPPAKELNIIVSLTWHRLLESLHQIFFVMSSATIGHINDEDFAGLNLAELDENEFQRSARAGFPLLLPWHRDPVRLGTGYHSSLQLTENPWASETPFILAELMLQAKVFRPEQGTTSSFTLKKTSRSAESNDHLTLGFGVNLSPPIPVVIVSVKGTFDQQVQENSDVSISEMILLKGHAYMCNRTTNNPFEQPAVLDV
jgi:hypothetical protein